MYLQSGQDARRDLGADAAVPVLLAVLKRNIPDVNDHAVKALAKFMEDADGRRRFLDSKGITTVADVLKCRGLEEVVLSHCIFILVSNPYQSHDTKKLECYNLKEPVRK